MIINILYSIILLGVIGIVWWVVFFLWFNKTQDIINLIPKINLKINKKKEAIIFDDEPKTEEQIAIEREERILKTIRGKE